MRVQQLQGDAVITPGPPPGGGTYPPHPPPPGSPIEGTVNRGAAPLTSPRRKIEAKEANAKTKAPSHTPRSADLCDFRIVFIDQSNA